MEILTLTIRFRGAHAVRGVGENNYRIEDPILSNRLVKHKQSVRDSRGKIPTWAEVRSNNKMDSELGAFDGRF